MTSTLTVSPKEASNMWRARQGDLLIQRVRATPRTRTGMPIVADAGRLILARGEATGHHHSVDAGTATLYGVEGDLVYLTVAQLTAVEHQEHAPILLHLGTYRISRQREWSDALAPRLVAD